MSFQGSHSIGALCPFKIEMSAESPFTGLLQASQKVSGLIRLSPNTIFGPNTPGLSVGLALKFLRSGVRSANIVMVHGENFLSIPSYDFFSVNVSNHNIADFEHLIATNPKVGFVLSRLCSSGYCINKVGLSDVCTYDQQGNRADNVIFPFKLYLCPADTRLNEEEPDSVEAFMDRFEEIPEGSNIYTMKAYVDPYESETIVLGQLITTGPCVSSYFGDTKLNFPHQRIEDDISLKPEWIEKYAEGCFCNIPKA